MMMSSGISQIARVTSITHTTAVCWVGSERLSRWGRGCCPESTSTHANNKNLITIVKAVKITTHVLKTKNLCLFWTAWMSQWRLGLSKRRICIFVLKISGCHNDQSAYWGTDQYRGAKSDTANGDGGRIKINEVPKYLSIPISSSYATTCYSSDDRWSQGNNRLWLEWQTLSSLRRNSNSIRGNTWNLQFYNISFHIDNASVLVASVYIPNRDDKEVPLSAKTGSRQPENAWSHCLRTLVVMLTINTHWGQISSWWPQFFLMVIVFWRNR